MRIFIGALSLAAMFSGGMAVAQGNSYVDNDWNTSFVDNCGLPNEKSVTSISKNGDRKVKITLNRGDKGRCSSDDKHRHRAPFWERAELAQNGRLTIGHRYQISTQMEFVKGFTGDREAFFQIHGWDRNCKKAFPPVMMKFDKRKMRVEVLRRVSLISSGRHKNALHKNVKIHSLYGKPMSLVLDFDTRARSSKLSVTLDGKKIVKNAKVEFAACANLHVKFGIYRPGGKGTGTSTVVFDDVQIKRIE